MNTSIVKKIQEMVDLETQGWDTKNPDPFLSMIHPDMAWPWPPTADAHDPIDWVFVMGRFDRERWRKNWQELFDSNELVHNHRDTVKIEISHEQDAAFAVVDIDTLWRHKVTKEESHWKFYYQTGVLHFPPKKIQKRRMGSGAPLNDGSSG